jgi:hypothetical protein
MIFSRRLLPFPNHQRQDETLLYKENHMLQATMEEVAAYAYFLQWHEPHELPPQRPFCGYGVTVIWRDGFVCDWHADSPPDVTGIAEVRPGVLSMLYALE